MSSFDEKNLFTSAGAGSTMRETAFRELRDAVTVIRLSSQLLQRRLRQRGSLDPAQAMHALLNIEQASVKVERALNTLQHLP